MSNYEEFLALQRQYPRGRDNDYLLPQDIRLLAERGKLRYIADEAGLFTLIKREGFEKLVFRLRDGAAKLPQTSGTVVAHIVYRAGSPPDAAKWLEFEGLRHFVRLERYKADSICDGPCAENFSTAAADELYEFLAAAFAPEEIDLPTRDMFVRENSFCHRDGAGKLQGAVYDMGHTRVVVVAPEARGLNIGGRLYRAFARARGGKFAEWIRPDNIASVKMFEKLGFVKDTAVSDGYKNEV